MAYGSTRDAAPRGWQVWRSDTGRLWATRAQAFSRSAEYAGAARTVYGDTWTEVCRQIAEQEAYAALAAAS